ncbi:transcriptional regulator [Burkholderia gladioli]|nr:YdaS family helix-turn-helix protein [Burkholderia gladioli]
MAAGTAPISPARCIRIERATGGAVTRCDLRPMDWRDIWPEFVPPSSETASVDEPVAAGAAR